MLLFLVVNGSVQVIAHFKSDRINRGYEFIRTSPERAKNTTYRYGTIKFELFWLKTVQTLMDKEDARNQTLEQLHERRKQVVR
ncbi:MAG: hypothetical protein PHU06_14960, partial [Gallionella sp.]|nr:hypothetical protein [Gallionella sp.]MDD4960506.1 hypothetical protein [Gallionella sp.]